jgi:hypothetical protein
LSASGGIPAKLRKKYNLHPGRKVKLWQSHSFGRNDDNGIKIIPLVTMDEVEENVGFLGTTSQRPGKKGNLLKALMAEKSSRPGSDGKREREL